MQLVQNKVTVSKMSENIGAEITGLDLTKQSDEQTQKLLLDTLHEHIVLVIRHQNFTPKQLVAAGRIFGELTENDQADIYGVADDPLIAAISNMHKDKSGNIPKNIPSWHTDSPHFEYPPKYTMLYPVHLPSSGGGTSFCNTRVGYQRLPPALKSRIEKMQTVNVLSGRAARNPNPLSLQGQLERKHPGTLQPLVRTNPDHGSKSVYFHARKTDYIVGMTPEETADLLDELQGHILHSDLIYTHKWQYGDFVIWDNRSSLHKAGTDFDHSELRLLYRMIVKGERPH